MENERFTAYYKAQNIVPEDEWEFFMDAFRQHLPTTFRVAGSRQCVSCCYGCPHPSPITGQQTLSTRLSKIRTSQA